MARLRSFTLQNFRSYREATLSFGTLTFLVGANASGKSNLIEGLQMLSWLARGQRLDDVFRAVQEAEMSIRGQPTHLARDGESSFSFACSIRLRDWKHLSVTIKSNESGLRIFDERVTDTAEIAPLYEVKKRPNGAGHDLHVAYNNFSKGGKKPQIACTDQQAVFTQLLTPARFSGSHKKAQTEIPKICKCFMSSLQQILFLDPAPSRMRHPSFVDDKKLRGDGSNLSSVLCSLADNPEGKATVLSFVKDLPEQQIRDIRFLRGPRSEVLVQLEETFGSIHRLRDASLLSDGTLRVLAVVAALLSAPEYSTVVMEEIDNGIHPSRAQALLANIQKIAQKRNLAVLITSHNPALLDALPESAIPDVVFCYRNPQDGDSQLARLEELTNYPDLVARGPLGKLVTDGLLDRMVKQSQSRSEVRKSGLRYLAALRKTPP
ncbi:MAG: AAA family ATPase [Planctomycetes bacterium]|nr:AAA family ATPase [Planctomycetota bacterium]